MCPSTVLRGPLLWGPLAVVDTRGEGISGDYQKDHDLASMGVVEGGLASLEDSIA